MLATIQTLSEELATCIAREGPITFHEWMRVALYDPKHGYYRTDKTRWGREGDYRTSPERSHLFAATFARYFARLYTQLGQPPQWTIAEVGAGAGAFARVLLQTLENYFPEVFLATRYVVVEVSANSRERALNQLERFAERVEFQELENVDVSPGIVFSNELLDSFPVHRVTMREGQLKEFYVGGHGGGFEWILGALSTERLSQYFEEHGIELQEGQIAEVNLEIEEWLGCVSKLLRDGYLICVDYGAEADELYSLSSSKPRHSGTLRGFRNHEFVEDLLASPGEHDLTTTVDWTFVRRASERLGFEVVKFNRQDQFLLNTGLLEQLDLESKQCQTEADRVRLTSAAREMILPDGMAANFQVLVQRKSA